MNRIIYAGSVGTLGKKASVSGCGEGVYTIYLNDLSFVKYEAVPSENAGIICMSKDRKYVYAANETRDFGGLNGDGGGISAYRIDDEGKLVFINQSLSFGSRSSYVSATDDNRYLLVSNHGSHSSVVCRYVPDGKGGFVLKRGFDDSSVALFSLAVDGAIEKLLDLKVFEGHGYWCHGGGQSTSHLHSVKVRGNLVFACNRGTDEIEILKIENDRLVTLNRFHTRKGYAPRHCVFHPYKNILYACNENYPSLSVFSFDTEGNIKEMQLQGTMDQKYYDDHPLPVFTKDCAAREEKNTSAMGDRTSYMPADIHITSDGRFLYVSNRHFSGNGNIACFRITEEGTTEYIMNREVCGKDPRGFQIMDDRYLICGILDQNKVQIFPIDPDTGQLHEAVSAFDLPSPASFVL
ncbi:MAG: beta-propeller fold lactonase family protein [Solobacterium sp.]|nr:beta-propeller fold lactonase family protein [Solobacterium sp.]